MAASAQPDKPWFNTTGLDWAAFITWAVIYVGIWDAKVSWTLPGLGARATVAVCMLGFITAYLVCMRYDDRHKPWFAVALLFLQGALALLVTWCVRWHSTPVLLIIVVAQMVVVLPRAVFFASVLAINATLFWMLQRVMDVDEAGVVLMLFAGFQAFAALTSHYAFGALRAQEDLAQVNAHLLATRSLLAETARDQERLRLARELHDVAGHKLTALKLNLSALARTPVLAGEPQIALAARLADELLGDIRGVVRQLREHEGMDLSAAIAALAAPLPRPRVHLAIAADAVVDDVASAEAVVRAVQEGLTNSARHSDAQNAWISLRRDGDKLALDIEDDGRGNAEVKLGHGLTGMRERLQALGGDLAIARARQGGLALHAWLPGPAGAAA